MFINLTYFKSKPHVLFYAYDFKKQCVWIFAFFVEMQWFAPLPVQSKIGFIEFLKWNTVYSACPLNYEKLEFWIYLLQDNRHSRKLAESQVSYQKRAKRFLLIQGPISWHKSHNIQNNHFLLYLLPVKSDVRLRSAELP